MNNYIKGFNTSGGKKPIFPPADDGKVWGTKDGEWQPVDPKGGVDETQLNEAVEAALERAKESGEFDGEPGPPGTSVTVADVTESTEDGGVNVVTFSDGKTLNVRNGKKGDPGYTPQKNVDYFDGEKGDPGVGLENNAFAGQFAVADGKGGVAWKTVLNAEEVKF